MDYETFDTEVLDKLFDAEKQIGLTKGKEYTQGDRLDNFKRLAQETGITPEQVLWIYLKKHLDSIAYYVRHGKLESESLESRILDARVYLSLLLGLAKEPRPEDKETLIAKQIQQMIDEERKKAMDNPADVFGNVLGDDSEMPLFCVGCGLRFNPDDMVDIFHVIETDSTKYNEYHHSCECIIVDDPIKIKSRNLIATKKASEILDDLDNHRKLRKRETETIKPLRTDQELAERKLNNILDIIKNSDKPLRCNEIFKMQSEYKSDASINQIINKKVKEGVLLKIDGMYSYNNGGTNDNT
jgi:hypothetical protein